jgi:tRNA A-37 threonylcarbamoyl transferase component Bud32
LWCAALLAAQGAVFRGSESELLRVARDVGAALAFMHARGVVHMDVKVRA